MGERYNPFLIAEDPSQPRFEVAGTRLANGIDARRVTRRLSLLRHIEPSMESTERVSHFRSHYATAEAMLGAENPGRVFEIEREPKQIRERYGLTSFGQSLLLARRLVEAGIRLITVNWDDESKLDKVSPHWDTHHQNFPRLREMLCPRFDQAFAAFLEDLDSRGLLDSTLVVAVGEFGRTPKIGQFTQNAMTEKTGRDHWPHAFTALIAGGGTRGGHVHGATDSWGGFVDRNPVTPADLTATILSFLGIDPSARYWDEFQQVERRLCEGSVIRGLA
jgi:uncharacterized protein (DUF1501 family)